MSIMTKFKYPYAVDTAVDRDLSGISFEKAVVRIQRMLDPESLVTHNEKLVDRIGNTRQFDVVVRGYFAGNSVLGVIECKDHACKLGPDVIDAFSTKCNNLGANLKVIVSRLGFTRQALKVAKFENIHCLSLLLGDKGQTGLSLRVECYAAIWSWEKFSFTLIPDFLEINKYKADDFLLDGKPILDLFKEDLAKNFSDHTEVGSIKRRVNFKQNHTIHIKGKHIKIDAVIFYVNRVCKYKVKEIEYFGDAVYDWQGDKWKLPEGGRFFSESWNANFTEWEDVVSLVEPTRTSPFQVMIDCFNLQDTLQNGDTDNIEMRIVNEIKS